VRDVAKTQISYENLILEQTVPGSQVGSYTNTLLFICPYLVCSQTSPANGVQDIKVLELSGPPLHDHSCAVYVSPPVWSLWNATPLYLSYLPLSIYWPIILLPVVMWYCPIRLKTDLGTAYRDCRLSWFPLTNYSFKPLPFGAGISF